MLVLLNDDVVVSIERLILVKVYTYSKQIIEKLIKEKNYFLNYFIFMVMISCYLYTDTYRV